MGRVSKHRKHKDVSMRVPGIEKMNLPPTEQEKLPRKLQMLLDQKAQIEAKRTMPQVKKESTKPDTSHLSEQFPGESYPAFRRRLAQDTHALLQNQDAESLQQKQTRPSRKKHLLKRREKLKAIQQKKKMKQAATSHDESLRQLSHQESYSALDAKYRRNQSQAPLDFDSLTDHVEFGEFVDRPPQLNIGKTTKERTGKPDLKRAINPSRQSASSVSADVSTQAEIAYKQLKARKLRQKS